MASDRTPDQDRWRRLSSRGRGTVSLASDRTPDQNRLRRPDPRGRGTVSSDLNQNSWRRPDPRGRGTISGWNRNAPSSNSQHRQTTTAESSIGSCRGPEIDLDVTTTVKGPATSSPESSDDGHNLSDTASSADPQHRKPSPMTVVDSSRCPETSNLDVRPFDICAPAIAGLVILNKSILELNRERKKELNNSKNAPETMRLRPGMILLKNFVTHHDQVKIIERCQKLGLGSGGFYTPGYRDGAKLHLQMMCLGKNWDPETNLYEDKRSIDGATPPGIPEEFVELVNKAFTSCYNYLRQTDSGKNAAVEVPFMSPDICIVNFYSKSGKLGLHRDEDESRSSLEKGLAVVSFSLGDSAEFLYGDVGDEDSAKKVLLESGDILFFGGKSRHIFHGVKSIIPNSAPKRLVDETKLRPGRLNLTFRQY